MAQFVYFYDTFRLVATSSTRTNTPTIYLRLKAECRIVCYYTYEYSLLAVLYCPVLRAILVWRAFGDAVGRILVVCYHSAGVVGNNRLCEPYAGMDVPEASSNKGTV